MSTNTENNNNDHVERIMNFGKEETLKEIGKVTFKELALEDLLEVVRKSISLFKHMTFSINEMSQESGIELVQTLIQDDEALEGLKLVASKSSELPLEKFNRLGLTSWLKIVVALKEVMNWEEIKELFFQILPKEINQDGK